MWQFESVSAFLHMGGHGLFVWSAYGITIAIMLWLLLAPLARSRTLTRQIHRHQQRAHSQNVSEHATAEQSQSQHPQIQHSEAQP